MQFHPPPEEESEEGEEEKKEEIQIVQNRQSISHHWRPDSRQPHQRSKVKPKQL